MVLVSIRSRLGLVREAETRRWYPWGALPGDLGFGIGSRRGDDLLDLNMPLSV